MKTQNQKAILAAVSDHMTDYPVDMNAAHRLVFKSWGGHIGKYGRRLGGFIEVYAPACAYRLVRHGINPTKDIDALGKQVLFVIAHEFRHTQQGLVDGPAIPTVSFAAHQSDEAYRTDPGESDANAFAKLVTDSESITFIGHLGRYARWVCKHQWEDFQAAATDQSQQKGA